MKCAENLLLEIRILDDGLLQARRKDRKPMTDEDHEEARQLASAMDSLPGVTVDDVLRVFPGAKVVSKR